MHTPAKDGCHLDMGMGVRHFENHLKLDLIDGNPVAVILIIGLLGCHLGLWVVRSPQESPINMVLLAEVVMQGNSLITGKP
jgi:hypothetical protein